MSKFEPGQPVIVHFPKHCAHWSAGQSQSGRVIRIPDRSDCRLLENVIVRLDAQPELTPWIPAEWCANANV